MHYSKVSFLIDKTLPLVLSKMECFKLKYQSRALTHVRGGKAWREENDEWVWLSVDPMHSERSWLTPYNYVQNNPVNLIDPDGMLDTEYNLNVETGKFEAVSDKGGSETDYYNIGTVNENGEFETRETVTIDRPESGEVNINSFRIKETDESTISAYNVPGTNQEGVFLEPAGPSTTTPNQNKRIPEGQYDIESYSSKAYPDNFRLSNSDVSKSRKILIHTGNYPKNTLGCLLPGSSFGKNAAWSSGQNFNGLRSIIKTIGPENTRLNINNVIR